MKFLLGNEIYGEKTSIDEIFKTNEPYDHVVVEGYIFDTETRGPFKNGSYLYKGAIWDGTSSMYYQFFSPLEIALENDIRVKMSGSTEKNQYTRGEYVLMVDGVTQLEIEEKTRIDEATDKRVELSAVANYSTHVSAMTGEQLVNAAKAMGHNAIALTDIGAVQGFPEAQRAAKKADMKLILGMKIPVVDDAIPIVMEADSRNIYEASYTVYDVETTGFSVLDEHLIEIGATKFINGEAVERFQTFIKPPKPVPSHITELTGITQEDVDTEGVSLNEAMSKFDAFWKGTVLVAHNAQFDVGHLKMAYKRVGQAVPHMVVLDTLQLSRMLNRDLKVHNLKKLSSHYKVPLASHHRADQDAEATGHIMLLMFEQLKELGFETLLDINERLMDESYFASFFAGDMTILVKNDIGLQNLYKLVSLAHSEYLGRVPMLPLRVVNQHREGLLIGSGSHSGFLFDLALNKEKEQVAKYMDFYDYFEIEPVETANHMVLQTRAESMDAIERAWKTIVEVGKQANKPIVATGYVHYIEKEDRLGQQILIYNQIAGMKHERRPGRLDQPSGYVHLRTTNEMKDDLTYLSEVEKEEYVVRNSNLLANMCESVSALPDKLFPPVVPDANERLEKESLERAIDLYGENLPKIVRDRLDKEVKSIVGNGFAVIYTISADLVKKSMSDGYLVGSRGSVGSSFIATMLGITEVNPLKPHYNCRECKWSLFFDHEELQSGYDLPSDFRVLFDKERYSEEARKYFFTLFVEEFGVEKTKDLMINPEVDSCPKCGAEKLIRDGQDIPFETFLGFKGDKVPDIDLNFSGEYQSIAHAFVGESKEDFGLSEVFRAGTIGTVASKTAFGYTKKYIEEHGIEWSNAEVTRVASRIIGAKRTTGQHAGGIIVVPKGKSITEFGGFQYPANDKTAQYPTTHYAFEHIHDFLCKLDILGHDDPTILRLLQDSTGIAPKTVPPNDEKVLKLFTNPEEALGIPISSIEATTGTLGVPEFGTKFVQQMVEQTRPSSFAELVKISGLSHGTDVWINNAQELVKNEICEFKEVIGCRDDIMVYLSQKGLEESLAFTIMESVRKGKGVKDEWVDEMQRNNVPDWYIESCKKIKYMFPKAHAAAYVLSALRIAYFKVYWPIHYYAAVLSVRYEDADITEISKSSSAIRQRIKDLEKEIEDKQKTGKTTTKEKDTMEYLKLVQEGKERGVKFGDVSIYGSHSGRWVVDGDVIVPPYRSVPGLGEAAALELYKASREAIFQGVEDLRVRGGVNKTTIDTLRGLGCLELIETKQHKFF